VKEQEVEGELAGIEIERKKMAGNAGGPLCLQRIQALPHAARTRSESALVLAAFFFFYHVPGLSYSPLPFALLVLVLFSHALRSPTS
jgi:hypothetical protein